MSLVKRSALASVTVQPDEAQTRHLHPVEEERKGAKFAALDHAVARVLGPHRGAAVLYGFLASTWFEFADPQKLLERKKKVTPGDWVEVNYRQFMAISGTSAKASIIRWLRILSEKRHPCPWGRCADEHPLVVVQRQGQSRSNRYRKWRCGEDVLVIRRRVRSQKLSEAARRRVGAGQRLNGTTEPLSAPMGDQSGPTDGQLVLESRNDRPEHEVSLKDFKGVSLQDRLKSTCKTSESLIPELQQVSQMNDRKSYDETSLREKTLNTDFVGSISEKWAANNGVAAVDQTDEVDAVACEVVDAILSLAHRVDSEYADERAWSVARQLATVVLETVNGQTAAARFKLLHAIADRRLARASNPVGLLIRGIVGDKTGSDRYLLARVEGSAYAPVVSDAIKYETPTGLPPGLHERLLQAIRSGQIFTDFKLREWGIPTHAVAIARAEVEAETKDSTAALPRSDELAQTHPTIYRRRLERILIDLELPKFLHLKRTLDHPMLLGMCRARLEADLKRELLRTAPEKIAQNAYEDPLAPER